MWGHRLRWTAIALDGLGVDQHFPRRGRRGHKRIEFVVNPHRLNVCAMVDRRIKLLSNTNMNRIILITALCMLSRVAQADDSFSLLPQSTWPTQDAAIAGSTAPLFHLMDLNKPEFVYLSAFRGKRVILFFTASWAESATQLVRLKRFREDFASQSHEALAISVDMIPRTRMSALLKSIGADDLPTVVDPMLTAAEAYGVRTVPALFFVDEHGKILLREEPAGEAVFLRAMKQINELAAIPVEPDPGAGEDWLSPKQVCRSLERKIKREPEVVTLRQQVAIAYYDAGLFNDSQGQFQVAEALDPNNPMPIVRWRMGIAQNGKGDREKAFNYWRSALSALRGIPLFQRNLDALEHPEKYYQEIPSATDVQ